MYQRIIHRRYRHKRYLILFVALILTVTATWFVGLHTYDFLLDFFLRRKNYDRLIKETADRYCVDPAFLKAVIWKESRFDQNARGNDDEIGLMQIKPRNGAATDWVEAHNVHLPCEAVLFNPNLNLEIGTWYLARAFKRWGKYEHCEELVLSEYNAGKKNAERWMPVIEGGDVVNNITIDSTRRYVMSIMNKYMEYASKRNAE